MTFTFLRGAALAAALLGTTSAFAQSATMQSNALLLKPLTLTNLDDLDFGSIIPSGLAGGDKVTIDAVTGARSSPTATLISSSPGKRARFASSGVNNTFIFLELSQPPHAPLTNALGDELILDYLVLDGSALRTLTPASQVFFVGIGGRIAVRPDQEDGAYTGTFNLTATYL